MKQLIINLFNKTFIAHKTLSIIISLVLALTLATTTAFALSVKKNEPARAEGIPSAEEIPSVEEVVSEEIAEEPIVSEETVSSKETPSSQAPAKKPAEVKKPAVTVAKPVVKPVVNTSYKYNTNMDIENNVFMDAIEYTGYNLKKHRADGLMWQYVLASQKRGKGWLSKIGYAGGSTGYETKNGKPDIAYFEKHGLVCASFVTYVYFNYLPNVAGIDTSSLDKPVKSYSANDWYIAAQKWVKKGYSKTISFTAKLSGGYIKFNPKETIPIGSIICMSDAKKPGSTHCSHVSVYAGYKNGYHWVYHVGNSNGPEFCAIERMHFGADPQWPLAVITTPANIRMAALLEVTVKDNNGLSLSGVSVSLKNTATGAAKNLGVTDKNGKITVENLVYGDYTVTQTVPAGYTCNNIAVSVKLTTANNSFNKVTFTDTLIPPPEPEPEPEPVPDTPPTEETPSQEETGSESSSENSNSEVSSQSESVSAETQ